MITAEKISFIYPDRTRALHNVSLTVADGEVLALMGANGCGKTTLLKHMIGLLHPETGKMTLDGNDFHFFKPEAIFKQVGMVFQDPNDQLFAATVEQDVAFGPTNAGLPPSETRQRVKEALMMVDSLGLAGRAIHTLSFGQKRRVTIAGVLAMRPRVMLLDEPTSGLDPQGVSSFMRLLHRLNREKGITIVLATHDIELIPLFCDRVALMKAGTLTEIGTPDAVFSDVKVIREAGMRLPRVAHLMEILQKKDGAVFSGVPLTIGQARRELGRLLTPKPR